ncbi:MULTISPECIES: hypothetical protein [unclassified Pseudoalteromonas]|jgi:hypothetical protein|uniref:hypothetical protein n=1 Tax=unclassified Pseudoalteromonas TaxID=194690 RepID=UPI0004205089|nr:MULTISPECIES: hypothetical protein [unclassified Pseudoalteromonas]MBB1380190.1 hypothetical protein [Pseudoalteromonas sp. SR43-2]MBH0087857.1 hypothetical protein [Pseudoalteromonas sp. NSLLW218]
MLKYSCLLIIFSSFSAVSQVTIFQQLNFGTVVVAKNERVSTLELLPNGRSSSTNDIHIIEGGEVAEVLIENFPPRVQLIISDTVNDMPLTSTSGGSSFILNKLLYRNDIVTNGLGTAEVHIGGLISTSGNNSDYFDEQFKSIIQITIEY